jgi:REP element-mobilizing transposase RayT
MWVHIIFSTKERYPFLKDIDIQHQLHNYIKTVCNDQGCILAGIGGVDDHVHLLINLNKNISLSSLIEKIKKTSSKWIKLLDKNNTTLQRFYWQRGYGAFSVSESNVGRVKLYIKNQARHHEKLTFKEEIKKFLVQHGVNFDEKYLWD